MRARFRRVVVVAVLVVVLAAGGVGALRIAAVNASAGDYRESSYGLNEEAVFPAYRKLESQPYDAKVRIEASGSFFLGAKEALELFPDASDTLSQAGDSGDVMWIVAEVDVKNAGTEEAGIPLTSVNMQMGSWSNGIDLLLFSAMNGTERPTVRLAPGESRQVLVPFLLSRPQFGFKGTWDALGEEDYELVLASYPAKVSIDLGKPSSTSPLAGKEASS